MITNVPGPQFPLYAAGAQMTETYPVQPLLPGHALAIGVTSYDGGVFFGVTADRDALPDLDVLGQCVGEALDELRRQRRAEPGSARRAAARRTPPEAGDAVSTARLRAQPRSTGCGRRARRRRRAGAVRRARGHRRGARRAGRRRRGGVGVRRADRPPRTSSLGAARPTASRPAAWCVAVDVPAPGGRHEDPTSCEVDDVVPIRWSPPCSRTPTDAEPTVAAARDAAGRLRGRRRLLATVPRPRARLVGDAGDLGDLLADRRPATDLGAPPRLTRSRHGRHHPPAGSRSTSRT